MSDPSELPWEQYRYFLTRELQRTSESLDKILKKVEAIEGKQIASEARTKMIGTIFGIAGAGALEVIVRVGEALFGKR